MFINLLFLLTIIVRGIGTSSTFIFNMYLIISYTKENCLDSWGGLCISGQRQSPINITPLDVIHTVFDDLKFINYDFRGIIEVTNLEITSELNVPKLNY